MLKWIALSALILHCDGFLQCQPTTTHRNSKLVGFGCGRRSIRNAFKFKAWTDKRRLVSTQHLRQVTATAISPASTALIRAGNIDRVCSVLANRDTQPKKAVEALTEACGNGYDLSETEWEIVLLNCQRFPDFAPLLKTQVKSEQVSDCISTHTSWSS